MSDILIDEYELNGRSYRIWKIFAGIGKGYKVQMEDDNGIHTLYFHKGELNYKNLEQRFIKALNKNYY